MDLTIILLGNGFLLSFILLVLLIILASQNGRSQRKKRGKVKEDIKKIKAQINGEDEE